MKNFVITLLFLLSLTFSSNAQTFGVDFEEMVSEMGFTFSDNEAKLDSLLKVLEKSEKDQEYIDSVLEKMEVPKEDFDEYVKKMSKTDKELSKSLRQMEKSYNKSVKSSSDYIKDFLD
jgi:hypothetical protein